MLEWKNILYILSRNLPWRNYINILGWNKINFIHEMFHSNIFTQCIYNFIHKTFHERIYYILFHSSILCRFLHETFHERIYIVSFKYIYIITHREFYWSGISNYIIHKVIPIWKFVTRINIIIYLTIRT